VEKKWKGGGRGGGGGKGLMIINDDQNFKKCHNACLSKHNERQARCSQRNDNAPCNNRRSVLFSYLKHR